MRIRGKLIATFGFIIASFLLAFTLIVYSTLSRTIQGQKDELLKAETNEILAELKEFTTRAIADCYHLANRVEKTGNRAACQEFFSSRIQSFPCLKSVAVISTTGSVIASAGTILPSSLPAPSAGSPLPTFVAASGSLFLCKPLPGGTLIYSFDLPALKRRLADAASFKSSDFSVLKGKVTVIPQDRGTEASAAILSAPRSGKPFDAGHLVAFSSDPDADGWRVVTLVPRSVYRAEVESLKNRLMAAMLVLLWSSVWIILIVSHRISRPIRTLSNATRDIVAFDYSTPLEVRETADEIGELAANFETMRLKIKELVVLDPLTGVYNRRFLLASLHREITRSLRSRSPLACLMLDLDHFKQVNDTYGHLCGDEVLRKIAAVMKETFREYDVCARYGGEEFAVVLPETGGSEAMEIAERIRKEAESVTVRWGEQDISVTVSVGIACLSEGTDSPEEMLAAADAALYQAKKGGRNRTASSCSAVNSG